MAKKGRNDWDCDDFPPIKGWRHGPLPKTCEWIEERDPRNFTLRDIPKPFWNRQLRIEFLGQDQKNPDGIWKVHDVDNETVDAGSFTREELMKLTEVVGREDGPKFSTPKYITRKQIIWIAHVVYNMHPKDAVHEWTAQELEAILDESLYNEESELNTGMAQQGNGDMAWMREFDGIDDGPDLDEIFGAVEPEFDPFESMAGAIGDSDNEEGAVWANDFDAGAGPEVDSDDWRLEF